MAEHFAKPFVVVDLCQAGALEHAALWLRAPRDTFGCGFSLVSGGPRQSEVPGIYARARAFIRALTN